MFRIFPVSHLVVQGPNSPFCLFVVNFDWVAIRAQNLTSTIACVQECVKSTHFTQCIFFSASRISMHNAEIASTADFSTRASFDPWKSFHFRSQADFKRCRVDLLARRKSEKNSSRHVFGPENVASSVIGEPIRRSRMRISDIVEVGDVQFTSDELHDSSLLGTNHGTSSPCEGKKRKNH